MFGHEAQQALVLSTLAGLSTGIGGAMAIIRKPGNQLLAALLGVAIGVMTTLSLGEMFIRNAMEHGWVGITLAVVGGALTYYLLQPYFPDFEQTNSKYPQYRIVQSSDQAEGAVTGARADNNGVSPSAPLHDGADGPFNGLAGGPVADSQKQELQETVNQTKERLRAAELLRLGLLMAMTMTLHNMPEGLAVAFSSFTDFGPYMAMAIAIHNIPEGVIVAAPVFAATGSRWKAMGVALASGLSEPLGALIALVAVKPFVSEEPLHYVLAFVGGIMTAVCAVELWPEARKCREDGRLFQGIAVGVLIMAGTLAIGV